MLYGGVNFQFVRSLWWEVFIDASHQMVFKITTNKAIQVLRDFPFNWETEISLFLLRILPAIIRKIKKIDTNIVIWAS